MEAWERAEGTVCQASATLSCRSLQSPLQGPYLDQRHPLPHLLAHLGVSAVAANLANQDWKVAPKVVSLEALKMHDFN